MPDSYRMLLAGPMTKDGNVDGMWAWQLDWSKMNTDGSGVSYVRDIYWVGFDRSMDFGWKSDAGRQHAVDFLQALRSLQLHAKSGALGRFRETLTERHSAEIQKYLGATTKPELPADVLKYKTQALSAVREGRLPDALMRYQQALAIAPWWPEGHFNMALLSGELGLYPEAVTYMKYYLLAAPDAPNARAAQGKIYEWEARQDGEKMASGKPVFFSASAPR